MAIENARQGLLTVKDGAQDYAEKVTQLAGEERFTSLPARALQVAELATQMTTLLEGIYKDTSDFNFQANELSRAARERLGPIAASAMEGSGDEDARYYITQGVRSLNSAHYEPEYYDAGRGLRANDAIEIAQRAKKMAECLGADQRDIETVAPGYAAALGATIDNYIQRL